MVSVLVFLSIPDAIVCALALAHRAVIWPELRLVGSPRALYLMVSTCHLFLLQDNCRGALLAAVCHNALLVMLLNAPVLQSETGKASGFVQVHQAESANVTLNANPCWTRLCLFRRNRSVAPGAVELGTALLVQCQTGQASGFVKVERAQDRHRARVFLYFF